MKIFDLVYANNPGRIQGPSLNTCFFSPWGRVIGMDLPEA